MERTISFGRSNITITDTPESYYKDKSIGLLTKEVLIEENRFIRKIFQMVKPSYPLVHMPDIFIADSDDVNALSDITNNRIIIFHGLLTRIDAFIRRRGSDEQLRKWATALNTNPESIRNVIFMNAIHFLGLHELYHIWHNHYGWKTRYEFNENGVLVSRAETLNDVEAISDENVCITFDLLSSRESEKKLTQQALELDADSSAICMMINCMMYEYDFQHKNYDALARQRFVQQYTAMIGGAITIVFEILFNQKQIGFDKLSSIDLIAMTHPIPAIRRIYAEEIIGAMLFKYFNRSEIGKIQRGFMDGSSLMEKEPGQTPDWHNVYYFTAHTKKCQDHHVKLKRRLMQMYDTMKELATGNMAEKLQEEDISYPDFSVAFTEDGQSLRGWK